LSGVFGAMTGDPQQIVSNLDQIGGVALSVQANVFAQVVNADAANPHSVVTNLSAVLEFEAPGSS
jgi:hypothetical protein